MKKCEIVVKTLSCSKFFYFALSNSISTLHFPSFSVGWFWNISASGEHGGVWEKWRIFHQRRHMLVWAFPCGLRALSARANPKPQANVIYAACVSASHSSGGRYVFRHCGAPSEINSAFCVCRSFQYALYLYPSATHKLPWILIHSRRTAQCI